MTQSVVRAYSQDLPIRPTCNESKMRGGIGQSCCTVNSSTGHTAVDWVLARATIYSIK